MCLVYCPPVWYRMSIFLKVICLSYRKHKTHLVVNVVNCATRITAWKTLSNSNVRETTKYLMENKFQGRQPKTQSGGIYFWRKSCHECGLKDSPWCWRPFRILPGRPWRAFRLDVEQRSNRSGFCSTAGWRRVAGRETATTFYWLPLAPQSCACCLSAEAAIPVARFRCTRIRRTTTSSVGKA